MSPWFVPTGPDDEYRPEDHAPEEACGAVELIGGAITLMLEVVQPRLLETVRQYESDLHLRRVTMPILLWYCESTLDLLDTALGLGIAVKDEGHMSLHLEFMEAIPLASHDNQLRIRIEMIPIRVQQIRDQMHAHWLNVGQ